MGDYLDYGPMHTRGPLGEKVHAVAYVHRVTGDGCPGYISLGMAWCHTAAEAKLWVEQALEQYLASA